VSAASPEQNLPAEGARRLQRCPGRNVGRFLPVCPLSAPRSANTMRHTVINLAAHIRDALPGRFAELAVFDACLYIRVRGIDEPA
jgi:hypothetical protein